MRGVWMIWHILLITMIDEQLQQVGGLNFTITTEYICIFNISIAHINL